MVKFVSKQSCIAIFYGFKAILVKGHRVVKSEA